MQSLVFKIRRVNTISQPLQPNTLYICFNDAMAAHLCACGCGYEVVEAFSFFDISYRGGGTENEMFAHLHFDRIKPCGSNYFIKDNVVIWYDSFHSD